jgi:hypothetical protein
MAFSELVPPSTLPRGQNILRRPTWSCGSVESRQSYCVRHRRIHGRSADAQHARVLPAGFHEQHAVTSSLGQSVGEHTAGRAGPHDDVVERPIGHGPLLEPGTGPPPSLPPWARRGDVESGYAGTMQANRARMESSLPRAVIVGAAALVSASACGAEVVGGGAGGAGDSGAAAGAGEVGQPGGASGPTVPTRSLERGASWSRRATLPSRPTPAS